MRTGFICLASGSSAGILQTWFETWLKVEELFDNIRVVVGSSAVTPLIPVPNNGVPIHMTTLNIVLNLIFLSQFHPNFSFHRFKDC
jgi:hypothetical protein